MSIFVGSRSCGSPSAPESVGLNWCCKRRPAVGSPKRLPKNASSHLCAELPDQISSTKAREPSSKLNQVSESPVQAASGSDANAEPVQDCLKAPTEVRDRKSVV